MRRVILILVLAVAAGFAAGQAAPKVKFPWLHESEREKLNAPCGKTELEWRCLEQSVNDKKKGFLGFAYLVRFIAKPSRTGMVVDVAIQTESGSTLQAEHPPTRHKRELARRVQKQVNKLINEKLCMKDVKPGTIKVNLYEITAASGSSAFRGTWDAASPVQ